VKGRKTGGRKAGTRNRRTVESERAATEAARKISATIKGAFEGDAHSLLMAIYKDPDQSLQVRMDAAKAALPYEKARCVVTEPKEPERGPIKFTFVLDHPDADPPEHILAAQRAANGGSAVEEQSGE